MSPRYMDMSMVGYPRGLRVGAIAYNVAHGLATGEAIAGSSLAIGSVPMGATGAILVAHGGMDWMAGYALKLPRLFQDTLGWMGRSH